MNYCQGGHSWTYAAGKDYLLVGTSCDCGLEKYALPKELKDATFPQEEKGGFLMNECKGGDGKIYYINPDGTRGRQDFGGTIGDNTKI